jgi:hypothetical protein
MPKRTNDFQKLVYLIRVNLASGARVTESKMLRDRITKRKREVDVCVEGEVGGQPVLVSVECRDHARLADVSWIDAMQSKHSRLPTNALILVSRRGFTPEARDVAASYGIRVISLSEIVETDFPRMLGLTSTLWSKTFSFSFTEAWVSFDAIGDLPCLTVAIPMETTVFSAQHDAIFPFGEVVKSQGSNQVLRDFFVESAEEKHKSFDLSWEPAGSFFLQQIEPLVYREIKSIRLIGTCEVEIARFGMQGGVMDGVSAAWGKSVMFGREAFFVATSDKGGAPKITVQLTPPTVPHQ